MRSLPVFPVLILVLAFGSVAWLTQREELERNLKGWLMTAIPLLAAVLLTLWFLLTPRFSGKTRLRALLLLVLAGVAAKLMLRVDGVIDGRGLPRLVWRWSAQPPPAMPATGSIGVETVTADPRLAAAADVPQFFGPNRDGISPNVQLSTDWGEQPPKELWRQPVGAGWSSFSVLGGRAYTQEQRGEQEAVTCYELLTGKLLWMHTDQAHFTQWQGGEGPRATPTLHQGRVYTYGATGILNCLDQTTGKPFWRRAVLEDNQISVIEWGTCASPLIVDDLVIVSTGRADNKAPLLIAYKLEDGVETWRSGQGEASYASPMLATLAGRRVILSNNAKSLTAHDPTTGSILLDHVWGGNQWPKASQPVVVPPNRVFLSAGYGMGCLLLEVSVGPDGKLTTAELWKGLKMKTQFNSPALHENHLYGIDDGRLACLELATGERLWKEGSFKSGQSLLTGNLVIVQHESGSVHLCAASPEGYTEHGRVNALSSKTWNHPALAGRYLLVRNDHEAVCYELPVK